MNGFNRLFVTLSALALAVGGLVGLGALAGLWGSQAFIWYPLAARLVSDLAGLSGPELPAAIAASAGAFLVGLLLLILELRNPRSGREVIIRKDKRGVTTVSLGGLRKLAEHVVADVDGVEEVAAEARRSRAGISFRCRVTVAPETSAPRLDEEIRERLGVAASNHTGLQVNPIQISFSVQAPSGVAIGKRRLQ